MLYVSVMTATHYTLIHTKTKLLCMNKRLHILVKQGKNQPVFNIPGVSFKISTGKLFHQSINFLSFAGQAEIVEEYSKTLDKIHVSEVYLVDILVHDFFAEAGKLNQK